MIASRRAITSSMVRAGAGAEGIAPPSPIAPGAAMTGGFGAAVSFPSTERARRPMMIVLAGGFHARTHRRAPPPPRRHLRRSGQAEAGGAHPQVGRRRGGAG